MRSIYTVYTWEQGLSTANILYCCVPCHVSFFTLAKVFLAVEELRKVPQFDKGTRNLLDKHLAKPHLNG